jgi:hypothetical protein
MISLGWILPPGGRGFHPSGGWKIMKDERKDEGGRMMDEKDLKIQFATLFGNLPFWTLKTLISLIQKKKVCVHLRPTRVKLGVAH